MRVAVGKTYTDGVAQRKVTAIYDDAATGVKFVLSETVAHTAPEFIGAKPRWRLSEFEVWVKGEVL